jgi:hypothetical protein
MAHRIEVAAILEARRATNAHMLLSGSNPPQ